MGRDCRPRDADAISFLAGADADKIPCQKSSRQRGKTFPAPQAPQKTRLRPGVGASLNSAGERHGEHARTMQQRFRLQHLEAQLCQHTSHAPRAPRDANRVGYQSHSVQQPERQGVADRDHGVGEVVHRQQQMSVATEHPMQLPQRGNDFIVRFEMIQSRVRYHDVEGCARERKPTDVGLRRQKLRIAGDCCGQGGGGEIERRHVARARFEQRI